MIGSVTVKSLTHRVITCTNHDAGDKEHTDQGPLYLSTSPGQYPFYTQVNLKKLQGALTGGRFVQGRPPAVVTVNVREAIRSGTRVANSVVDTYISSMQG